MVCPVDSKGVFLYDEMTTLYRIFSRIIGEDFNLQQGAMIIWFVLALLTALA